MVKRAAPLAKLSRPRLHEAVPRERLFALLDDQQQLPVTLIAAPPGAGKTTLVASYLESRKLPGIWYQVDPGDSDPSTLFYFLGLAERVVVGKRANLHPLPLFTPEYLADLPAFSRRFFRELFSRLDTPAVVVFDNFQEAAEDSALHTALLAALEEVPLGLRVMLVSRHPPPDRYARLAANRAMALLDWEALKLTPTEAVELLGAAHLSVAASTAEVLHERSGGWAAGLVLLAEHFRRGRTIESIGDPDSLTQVFAYFAGQLFDQAPATDRLMLLELSFLPSIAESHARELTGGQAGPRLLDALYRRHLFTDRRRGSELVYTFHALFRAFLQHRAASELSTAQRVDTARRAAQLLQLAGQPEAAMQLYLSVGDFEAADELVHTESAALIGQGRWKVVVEWIEALPAERVAQRQWLLHWLGTALIGVDPARARGVIDRAYAVAIEHADAFCQIQCGAGMVEAYFLEYSIFTPVDPWIAVLETMFAPDFQCPSLEFELRAQSAMLIAATYRQPDHPQIERCVERVRELLGIVSDVNLRVSAGTFLTIYGSFTGHLDESQRAAAVVSPLLSDPAVHIFRRIFAWAVICWYTCNVSDYELGEHAIAAKESLARDEGMHIAERFACILGYFLDMDRCDHAAGRRRIDRFERIMIPSQPYEAASLVNMKSWFGVYTEDAGPTRQHALEAVRLYAEAGSIPHIMVGCNALIWGCVESRDEVAARRAIAEHRQWSSRRNLEWARWAPDAAEAILAMRAGDEALLRDRLGMVFGAERHRLDQYGHQFAWCRGWASTLSAEALRREIEPERVRRFIREFDLAPPSPEIEAWPWPIKITTLGHFELCVDGQPLSFSRKPPRKTLALVKALVAMGSRNVKDYQIIDALWRDQEGDVARDAFRVALHRLRRMLGQSEAVLADEGRLTLNPSLCWIDAVAFEELVQRQHGTAEAGASAEILLRLYRGPFLADEHDEPWAAAMRARLNGKFVQLVSKLGTTLEQAGHFDAAVQLYLQGIDADPVGESFYQGLMRCYRDSGKPAEAIGVYRRLRQTLSAVLGIQPSTASESLHRDLLILAG